MTSTVRITHIATGAKAVTVTVLQQQPTGLPLPIAEHTLKPGETLHTTVNDAQRIVVIEPAPSFAEQLANYRANAPTPTRVASNDEVNRAVESLGTRD